MTTITTHQGPMIDYWGTTPPPDIIVSAVVCPAWCLGHYIDGEDAGGRMVIHYGPDFGLGGGVWLATRLDGTPFDEGTADPTVAVATEEYEVGPERLRKLAADALAAADWLEANR